MDQRTLDYLIGQGVLDAERVTTKVTTRRCRTCQRVILAALADDGPDVAGIRANLDPRPLTPLGELMALTAGIPTYAVIDQRVTWRCTLRITASPAGTAYPVHHSHRCEMPPGIEYAPTVNTRTAPARPQYDHPSF